MGWGLQESDTDTRVRTLSADLLRTITQRHSYFRAKDWYQVELLAERETGLGSELFGLRPTKVFAQSLAVSLWYLGRALLEQQAGPEAEEPLARSVALFRRFGEFESRNSDPDLIDALYRLAEVYRGVEFYVDDSRSILDTPAAMQAYRRAKVDGGGRWGDAHFGFVSEGWRDRAEPLLDEAVSISRRLAQSGDVGWQFKLANALHQLAVEFARSGRVEEAVSAFDEVIDLSNYLSKFDPGFARHKLSVALRRREEALSAH